MGVFVYHRILFHHFPFLINSKSLLTAAKCDSAVVASWPGNQALNNEMKEGMEVLMEAYPVTFQTKEVDDPDRTSWSLHPDWLAERQYQSICSVTVDKEGIRNSSDWLFRIDDFIDYYDLGGQGEGGGG